MVFIYSWSGTPPRTTYKHTISYLCITHIHCIALEWHFVKVDGQRELCVMLLGCSYRDLDILMTQWRGSVCRGAETWPAGEACMRALPPAVMILGRIVARWKPANETASYTRMRIIMRQQSILTNQDARAACRMRATVAQGCAIVHLVISTRSICAHKRAWVTRARLR